MGSEVEVNFCSKDKGKKTSFQWSAFVINYVLAHKPQITFMRLDFEVD